MRLGATTGHNASSTVWSPGSGVQIDIRFDEALGSTVPAASQFTVSADGVVLAGPTKIVVSKSIPQIVLSGFTPPIREGQTVRVAYGEDDDLLRGTAVLEDGDGNAADPFELGPAKSVAVVNGSARGPGRPGAPTGLVAAAMGDRQIDLSWQPPADNGGRPITAYRVEWSANGISGWQMLGGDLAGTATTLSDTGLEPGTTRHYRVTAITEEGASLPSGTAQATTTNVAPGRVTGLGATPVPATAGDTSTAIGLAWTKPSNEGASAITGYRIEWSSNGMDGTWQALVTDTGMTSAHTDSGLPSETRRFYRVRAFNAQQAGSWSETKMATTVDIIAPVPVSASVPETGDALTVLFNEPLDEVAANAPAASQFTLSGADGASFTPGSVSVSGRAVTLASIAPKMREGQAIVLAYADLTTGDDAKAIQDDAPGNDAKSFTLGPDEAIRIANGSLVAPDRPGAPSTLSAAAAGATRIDLTWRAPSDTGGLGLTGYLIQISLDAGTSWTALIADTGLTLTSYAHTGLTAGSTRHYRVAAINSEGAGVWSNVTNATTAEDTPGQVTGLAARAMGGTRIDLAWEMPTDQGASSITGYRIEWSPDGTDGTWQDLVANTGTTVRMYSDTMGLTSETERHYRVSAINDKGQGPVSAVATATTADIVAPVPVSASVASDGASVTVVFDDTLDEGTDGTPNRSRFAVHADGARIGVSRVEVDGPAKQVVLRMLVPTVKRDQEVAVEYTAPTPGTAALQDESRNLASSFELGPGESIAVTNDSTLAPTAPERPTRMRAEATGDRTIALTWRAPTNTGGRPLTAYLIEFSEDGGTIYDPLVAMYTEQAEDGTILTAYTDTGLEPGTRRHYRVRAINEVGTGAVSDADSATTSESRPGRPTGLEATARGGTQIDLAWNAPSHVGDSAITGYRIEWSPDGTDGTWQVLVADTGNTDRTYSNTALTSETTRHYRIAGINSEGPGLFSASASATTDDIDGPVAQSASVPAAGTSVVITFDEALDETAANVPRSSAFMVKGDDGARIGVGTVAVSGTTVTLSSLSPVVRAGQEVTVAYTDPGTGDDTRAVQDDSPGNDAPSFTLAPAKVTNDSEVPAKAPARPTGLDATAAGDTQIDLAWTAPADTGGRAITGYKVEWSEDGTTNWETLIADTGSAATKASDPGDITGAELAPGTMRYYRVAAINAVGTGMTSDPDSATTTTECPGPPENFRAMPVRPGTSPTTTAIKLTWVEGDLGSASHPITAYELESSADGNAPWTTVADDIAGDATMYEHGGLDSETTLHYRLRAINMACAGDWSTTASATSADIAAPQVQSASVPEAGTSVLIVFDQALDATAANVPEPGAFTVTADGAEIEVGSVAISGSTLTLTLTFTSTSPVDSLKDGQAIVVAYADPTAGDARAAQDAAGNEAAAFTTGADSVPAVSNGSTQAPSAPGAPTGLKATPAGDTQIDLSWSAPARTGGSAITGYQIEWSPDGSSNWEDLVDDTGSTDTTYEDTGAVSGAELVPGTTRHYRVSAINQVGTGSASASSGTTTTDTVPPVPQSASVAPAGTSIAIVFDETLDAATARLAQPGAFTVTAEDGAVLKVASVAASARTLTLTLADTPAGEVAPTIRTGQDITLAYADPTTGDDTQAIQDEGSGNDVASFTLAPAKVTNGSTQAATAPDAPRDLDATVMGDTQIDIEWKAPAVTGGRAVTGYEIKVSIDGGANYTTLVATHTGTKYSHTGLTAGSTRHYRVSAINSEGTGTAFAAASAETTRGTAAAPTGLAAEAVPPQASDTTTAIALSWTAPTDLGDDGHAITGYRVESSPDGTNGSWEVMLADTGSTATTLTHSGLASETTRHYRVAAINAAGTGAASAPASATSADIVAPTPVSASVPDDGRSVAILFDEPLDATTANVPAKSRFSVSATDGMVITVGTVSVSAETVTLELATASPTIRTAQAITIAYEASGSGNPIQDDGPGHDAASFTLTGTGVTNGSMQAPTAPGKPTGLAADAAGDRAIRVQWSAPADTGGRAITGYRVEWSPDGSSGSWNDLVANTGSTTTSYEDTGAVAGAPLAPATTRHYRVSAINSVGTGAASDTDDATTTRGTPGAPGDFAAAPLPPGASPTTTAIRLSWTEPTDRGTPASPITGYAVESSTDGNAPWTTLADDIAADASAYTHGGLASETTLHYRVRAANSAGSGEWSSSVEATSWDIVAPMAQSASVPADGRSVAIVFDETLDATTANLPAARRFTLTAADGMVITVGTVSVSAETVTLTLASASPTIRTGQAITVAYTASGSGKPVQDDAPGNNAEAFTLAPAKVTNSSEQDVSAPGAPTGVEATAMGDTQINVAWTAPADTGGSAITGYRVEWSADGSDPWTAFTPDLGATARAYEHTGLSPATTRSYRVFAINDEGTGDASSSASATTLRGAPGAPTDLTAMAGDPPAGSMPTAIRLSWTAPDDLGDPSTPITGYRIEWSPDGESDWQVLVADTESTEQMYTNSALPSQTTRHYRVSAINAGGTGAASNTAHATSWDIVAPMFESAEVPAAGNGETLELVFDEPVHETRLPPTSAFTVQAGTTTITIGDIEAVEITVGTEQRLALRLTGLSPAIRRGQEPVVVSYNDPTTGNDGEAVQDATGNDADDFTTGQGGYAAVTNRSNAAASAPGPVRSPMAEAASDTSIRVSWDAPAYDGGSAITDYVVEVCETSCDTESSWAAAPGDTVSTDTEYTHTGLEAGDVRSYRISAKNTAGTGEPSDVVASATALDGTVELTVAAATVAEGESARVTVRAVTEEDALPGSGFQLVIALATEDGTATTADGDFDALTRTVTFSRSAFVRRTIDGEPRRIAERTFSVPVTDDVLVEADETFSITASIESAPSDEIWLEQGVSADVSIPNTDAWRIALEANPASMTEGTSEQITLTARAVQSRDDGDDGAPAPAGECVIDFPVTVSLGVAGTATAGTDYTLTPAAPPTLSIPACTATQAAEASTQMTLASVRDTVNDADETVVFQPTITGTPTIAPSAAPEPVSVTLRQEPGLAAVKTNSDIALSDLRVLEEGSASYAVALTAAPTGTVRIRITVEDGTASAQGRTTRGATTRGVTTRGAGDVTVSPSTLQFNAANWQTPQTVTVTARKDADKTDEEVTIVHSVSGGGYGSVRDFKVPLTVIDNDADCTKESAEFAGDVRLCDGVSFRTSSEVNVGRLEVFHRQQWGTVCDDRINQAGNYAAAGACRMMGFAGGRAISRPSGARGAIEGSPIWLDDVRCFSGTHSDATKLEDCYRVGPYTPTNCTHDEDVWLECTGEKEASARVPMIPRLPTVWAQDVHVREPGITSPSYVDGDVARFNVWLRPPAEWSGNGTYRVLDFTDVTVDYAITDGTATGGAACTETSPPDFVSHAGGTLTFRHTDPATDDRGRRLSGQYRTNYPFIRKVVEVSICEDSEDDSHETFTLTLSDLSNAVLREPGDASATATIYNHGDALPIDELTASFTGAPESHGGAPFTLSLEFSEAVAATSADIAGALSATGGTIGAVSQPDAADARTWNVPIEPATRTEPVTVILAATTDCAADGAICTEGGLALMVGAQVEISGQVAPYVTAVSLLPDGSGNNVWSGGEQIEVVLEFNEPVTVSGGVPGVDVAVAESPLPIWLVYREGSGTTELLFSERLHLDADDLTGVHLIENSLALYEARIVSQASGRAAVLTHPGTEPASEPRTWVTETAVTSGPGDNGVWDQGEVVEARVRFSAPVTVSGPAGASPTLTVLLDGARRQAAYTGGSGSDTLRFAHTVAERDAGAVTARIAPNGLSLNGSTITDEDGRAARTRFFTPPYVTHVEVLPEGSGDGFWTGDELLEVALVWSESVAVEGGNLEIEIQATIAGFPGALGYTGGSATDRLVFATPIAGGRWERHEIAVVPNSLRLTDAEIVAAASGLPADLEHPGTETEAEEPPPEPLTAAFHNVPESHSGAAFTLELRFSEAPQVTAATLMGDGNGQAGALIVSGGTITDVTAIGQGDGRRWTITVTPHGSDAVEIALAATSECTAPRAVCTADSRGLAESISTQIAGPPSMGPALTATFHDVPETHGGGTFTFELRFSEEVSVGYQTLGDAAFQVAGAAVSGARRVTPGSNMRWAITVEPDPSADDVTVTLPATTDCAAPGAICTPDTRPLSEAVSVTVAAEIETEVIIPLTVELIGVPDEHDGATPVVFEVRFSKEPTGFSFRTLRDETLQIAQGATAITPAVRRLESGSNARWEVTVEQTSGVEKRDISVVIEPTTDCAAAGAVCADGQMLSNGVSEVILGPPGLSVADARAEEGVDETIDFAVTLSRESVSTITVDYATSDGAGENPATAGEDYTHNEGTLTFAPGETAKTVAVPILDDAHDEGEETFVLTLSNPSGGNAYLADGEAVGTIENHDAMPRAWLARFGRTVAEQVVDAVQARLTAARSAGTDVTLAGQAVGAQLSDEQRAELEEREAADRIEAFSRWLKGETNDEDGLRSGTRELTGRDLLTSSSFALTSGTPEAGYTSFWGRGALTRFDGQDGHLTLDGEVGSVMLGGDVARERTTLGLMLGHSRGDGTYRSPEGNGEVESTLTGLYPYGHYELNRRVSLWGVAGYGAGTLTMVPDGLDPLETDMSLLMGAVGVRGVAVEAPAEGGIELAVTSDALAVRTSSARTRGLASAHGDVTRLRLGLEGAWRGLESGAGAFVPTFEVGVRHDAGDAETGFGLDAGAALSWSHPGLGLTAELSGRGLLTHESSGFGERGLAGSLTYDARPDSDRGFTFAVSQTMGAQASGGTDALLGHRHLGDLTPSDESNALDSRALELRLGYGFPVWENRLTATPEARLSLSGSHREYALGWRLGLARTGPVSLEMGLEATRREARSDASEANNALMLRGSIRF